MVLSLSTDRCTRHSIACLETLSTLSACVVVVWCARTNRGYLRVSVRRWIWEDCWWVSTSPWIECHCIQSAFPCPRWLEWLRGSRRGLLQWISWYMWNRSAIHCERRLVNDSSSCWTRVGDCIWCNRCRCTVQSRRKGSQCHSNTSLLHVHNV